LAGNFLAYFSSCLVGQAISRLNDLAGKAPDPRGALSFFGWLVWLEPKEESAGAATKDILLKRINYQKGIDIM